MPSAFALLLAALCMALLAHSKKLPVACLRLFTQPSQRGEWLDLCGSNPVIPEAFALTARSLCLSEKIFRRRQAEPFYLLFNTTHFTGGGEKVLFRGQCRDLLLHGDHFVVRSALQCARHRASKEVTCATLPRPRSRTRE